MRALLPITVLVLLLSMSTSEQPVENPLISVTRSNSAFSRDLYQELAKTPGNVFFSPLSVHTVLAMTWMGARTETSLQMAAGLHLPNSRQQVETGFNELLTRLQNVNDNITLDIANKIYVQMGLRIKEEFQQSAERGFLASAENVDFVGDAKASANAINQWVEEKTRNKIKDIISEGDIDSDTLMVLINAMYFKGKWMFPFDKQLTEKRPFHVDTKTIEDVEMMHNLHIFQYYEIPNVNAKVLQLQYLDEELSMLIILPNEIEGLSRLEAKLDELDMTHIVTALNWKHVNLSLPKFKLETSIELNDPLLKLGFTTMFSDLADFSGMTESRIKVSKVIQKAFIEVTEEGSEAAAATAVIGVAAASAPINVPPIMEFKADHPFIFLIKENYSGAVLFAGRFTKPQ